MPSIIKLNTKLAKVDPTDATFDFGDDQVWSPKMTYTFLVILAELGAVTVASGVAEAGYKTPIQAFKSLIRARETAREEEAKTRFIGSFDEPISMEQLRKLAERNGIIQAMTDRSLTQNGVAERLETFMGEAAFASKGLASQWLTQLNISFGTHDYSWYTQSSTAVVTGTDVVPAEEDDF